MNRNTILLISVSVLYVFLIGWLSAEIYWKEIPLTEAVFGTIFGALLAGLFGLVAAIFSAWNAKLERDRDSKAFEIATLQGIVTKLIDLQDRFQKNYQHVMTRTMETRVFFGPTDERSFSKPVQGFEKHISFSTEERTFVLRRLGSGAFSDLNDVLAISENFYFLQKQHEIAFLELMDEATDGADRKGYFLSGEISTDSLRLMKMMDIDGLFKSLLVSSQKTVRDTLHSLISELNELAGSKLRYESVHVSPTSKNVFRQDY